MELPEGDSRDFKREPEQDSVLLGKLSELAELPSDTGKTERAFELLGRVLSTITGVPSARDHRKVLEQILAVRQQQEGMLGLMKQQNRQDAQIVKRFHSYETKFQRTENYINALNDHCLLYTSDAADE